MADSRLETTFDSLVASFKGIKTANGYRTTVQSVTYGIRPPAKVVSFPEVGLELGDSVLKMLGDSRTVYDEVVSVNCVGWVKADTLTSVDPETEPDLFEKCEALVHDIKVLLASLLTANINSSTNKWNVELRDNELRFQRVMGLGETRNIGLVATSFSLRVRAQGSTFT